MQTSSAKEKERLLQQRLQEKTQMSYKIKINQRAMSILNENIDALKKQLVLKQKQFELLHEEFVSLQKQEIN